MTNPPKAAKKPFTRSFHGHDFVDNYEWMRDKDAAETIEYLNAENAYTDEKTAHLATLRENIFQEIKSRVKETDMSVPVLDRGYFYYGRSVEGQSYGISCRIKAEEGEVTPPEIDPAQPHEREEILLDLNQLAEGHEYFALGISAVTTSGQLLGYSTDVVGDERYTIQVKDLATGDLLADEITNTSGVLQWAGDDYFYYSRVDEAWRPYQVWLHKIGTDTSDDVLVYEEADERFWVGLGGDRSDKYTYIFTGSKLSNEILIIPVDDPTATPVLVCPRQPEVEYSIDYVEVAGQTYWLVMHNLTGPNFELGYTPLADSFDLTQLTTLVPHRDDVRLTGLDCYARQIVLGYRAGAIGRVAIMDITDGWSTFEEVTFDEELYSAGMGANPDWNTRTLRMAYESFTTPGQVFNLDLDTGERTVLKTLEVLGGYDPEDYQATRIWAQAEDGTRIPVSLVHRSDLDITQPNPLLLYAYGSYEHPIDPGFSEMRLSLLDRGMIFAIAHVRGGGEMGRLWYDHGKTLTKRNTFTDYVAVADHLLKRRVTTSDQMVAMGGSAGGLLMGAIANLAGDRFKGVFANVPFVDPLTSMLKPELPLTVTEWDEWGDPLHDKQVYEYMASYAPYENVAAQPYPNILAATSLNDTRVLYVEPAKWIAKLRDTATSGEFLLKTEMAAGHGGVSGRYESWRQLAFEYAWVINQATGLEK